MAVEIQVPELGESVTEATVGKWLKSEGDAVEAGEPLVELETDKINFEVEAEQDGVLESIAKGEGEDVGVGEVIGTIGEGSANRGDGAAAQETEEDEAEQEEGQEEESQEEESQEEQPAAEAGGEETNGHREDSGVRASPSVRKLAGEYDVDLAEVSGSGAGGRVTKDDVERLIRVQSRGDSAQEESPERDGQKEEAPSQAAQNGRGDLEERIRLSR
ncbi:MAG TPA: biotin/lipoyl-containing protein, partial [Rubrobacter sp.]|nr:biotin/lipoyl-containing protein [Rubrobacter sp.]